VKWKKTPYVVGEDVYARISERLAKTPEELEAEEREAWEVRKEAHHKYAQRAAEEIVVEIDALYTALIDADWNESGAVRLVNSIAMGGRWNKQ
jgi:molecular chaperone GrpE (heat shock protein)